MRCLVLPSGSFPRLNSYCRHAGSLSIRSDPDLDEHYLLFLVRLTALYKKDDKEDGTYEEQSNAYVFRKLSLDSIVCLRNGRQACRERSSEYHYRARE